MVKKPIVAKAAAAPTQYDVKVSYRVRVKKVVVDGSMTFRPNLEYTVTGEKAQQIKDNIASAERV